MPSPRPAAAPAIGAAPATPPPAAPQPRLPDAPPEAAVPAPRELTGLLVLLSMLAHLGEDGTPALPEPVEVHIEAIAEQPRIDLMFADSEHVRTWSAALRMGEPAIRFHRDLWQRDTFARAIVGGWMITLRHIHTGR